MFLPNATPHHPIETYSGKHRVELDDVDADGGANSIVISGPSQNAVEIVEGFCDEQRELDSRRALAKFICGSGIAPNVT